MCTVCLTMYRGLLWCQDPGFLTCYSESLEKKQLSKQWQYIQNNCVMGRLCAEHGCFEKGFLILFEGENGV